MMYCFTFGLHTARIPVNYAGQLSKYRPKKSPSPMKEDDKEPPVHLPIDGILDLHNFNPSDLNTLIDEYIRACMEKGIHEIRIIHGKGTGALRRSVHHLLDRNRNVSDYQLAGDRSGWGATTATLVQSNQ